MDTPTENDLNNDSLSIEQLIEELDDRIYQDTLEDGDIEFSDECYEIFKKNLEPTSINRSRLLELNGILNYLVQNYREARDYFADSESYLDENQDFISKIALDVLNNYDKERTRPLLRSIKYIGAGMIVVLFSFSFWANSDTGVITLADDTMSSLADNAGMTKRGKAIFLRTNPELVSSVTIVDKCGTKSSSVTIESGCYIPDENKIYIRDMPSELGDSEIVTASHEMLHAVEEIDGIPDSIAQSLLQLEDHEEMAIVLSSYENANRYTILSELHSFVGTDLNTLPSELVEYYSVYFEHRSKTLNANSNIESVFVEKSQLIDSLEKSVDSAIALSESHYSNHVYAARNGDGRGAEYYWNMYSTEFDKMIKLNEQYESEIESYNLLAEQFNGKPFETKKIEISPQL